ncbi:DUF7683 domain-containing protein [Burkholderia glumae]|uniref:DUF7683 domain-containing protein n=1 Tax=Burkholderia glumae TaxID=337 RepID=A0AAP9Y285_BURGL|nr:hypothetical protein [Burkholderia glumae]AJY66861.1 hypothetical protein KS03_3070 [Burkholderia glumae LMG 2196 = ATCC 33617]KHJ61620.1 hypothetical protein NCPPB3923_17790 [Burkholderia glumae]MCM2482937.1 hypothetical protein [Burkholderia glumae]MCM2506253.1 hypothetical protein [Burkholderia glumae]MCM2537838.1 hypothetical protein [Burkholderia glumae]
MSHESVRRYISVFNKKNGRHVKDLSFVGQPEIQLLHAMFSVGADDPMYDEYQIDEKISRQLTPFVREEFDFKNFECFLSCDSVP